jgi:tryptophan halogenase
MIGGPLGSIVVAGGGIVALSAAAAFARALPQVTVTLLQTPLDLSALTDRLPGTQPSVARFHALIGLDEAEVVASGAATWRIATRYHRWSAEGEDWYHVVGEHGPRMGTIGFHHLWARARRSGDALPFHAYCAAGAMAAAGKFAHPVDDPQSPFSRFDYALRLAPDLYLDLLARHCDAIGVRRLRSPIVKVDVDESGAVVALDLAHGRSLSGDLYIDCTGPGAEILSRLGGAVEDWSCFLPAARVAISDAQDEAAAVDQVTRTATGWQWHAPGAGSGQVCGSEEQIEGAAEIIPGRRPSPWTANVLAIGDAAVMLDPLGWFGLHLAHQAIERALSLLPDRTFSPIELAEYNRRTSEDALAVRDLGAAFYHCPAALAGPFWERARALAMPASLAASLELFSRRGYQAAIDEDTIGSDSRVAALIGLGFVPRQTDPVADAIPPDACRSAMTDWAEALAAVSTQLPAYGAYRENALRYWRSASPMR